MTKENFLSRRKLLAILFGFIIFQLVYFPLSKTSFGFIQIPLFGTLAFAITMLTAAAVNILAFKPNFKTQRDQAALAATSIFVICAAASLVRASFVDRFILSALSAFWWALSIYLFSAKDVFGSLGEVIFLPFKLAEIFTASARRIIAAMTGFSMRGTKLQQKSTKILLGLILTIPTVIVLGILLASADPVFNHYLGQIFKLDVSLWELIAQVFWRLFFSVAALVAIAVIVDSRLNKKFHSPLSVLNNRHSYLLTPFLMLTITVSVLLISFLTIQFQYIFGLASLTDLTNFGILTFSEYVKKGFVELLMVTAIVYAISGGNLLLHRSFKPEKIYIYANSILILVNLVLAASVFRRVYLYVSEHGFTRMRIYGAMILLIIVLYLLTLFARYLLTKHRLYLIEVLGATLILFAFAIVNTDYWSVKLSPPTVNKQVDINYIAELSPDAYSVWLELIKSTKDEVEPFLEKENLSDEEKVKILRANWAMDAIYWKMSGLIYKYGTREEQRRFTETYLHNENLNTLSFNYGEFAAYKEFVRLTLVEEDVEFMKLLEPRVQQINISGIPSEAYEVWSGPLR